MVRLCVLNGCRVSAVVRDCIHWVQCFYDLKMVLNTTLCSLRFYLFAEVKLA